MVLDQFITQIKELSQEKAKPFQSNKATSWTRLDSSDLVLGNSMAVELGAPDKKSLSFFAFTSTPGLIAQDEVSLIGKDIKKLKGKSASYAKVVLIEIDELNLQEEYDKILALQGAKHDLHLEGFMIRSMSTALQEWTRISKTALKKGFSFEVLGNEIIKALKGFDYVKNAQVLFITEEDELIEQLAGIGEKVHRTIKSMNTIFDNIEHNCGSCNLEDICDEIGGMQLHRKEQSK